MQHTEHFGSRIASGLLRFQIFSLLQDLPWAGVPSGSAESRKCLEHRALHWALSADALALLVRFRRNSSAYGRGFKLTPFPLAMLASHLCLVIMGEARLNDGVSCYVASHCSVSKETVTRNRGGAEGCSEGLALSSFWLWESFGVAGTEILVIWMNVCFGKMCQESSELWAHLIYTQYTSWVWRRKEKAVLIKIKE